MTARVSTLALLRPDFAERVAKLRARLFGENIPLEVFESVRSPSRQAELYAQGRVEGQPGWGRTVTKAKPYQSAHQYGLAVDFVFKVNDVWTWDEPEPLMWSRFTRYAVECGLQTLSFEKPHVQMDPFSLHALQPGPFDTRGWLEWLAKNNGAGAVPELEA